MMIKLNDFEIGGNNPFVLIAGPCVIENEEITLFTAERLKEITNRLSIPLIFKSSFKKANRTSLNSFVGLKKEDAFEILRKVKKEFDLPIITDVHNENDAEAAAEVVDILQIPAFLCRQTELLIASGKTGRIINIKKGQFLAPWDMKYAADKVKAAGNNKILLTERGTTFGYGNLVVDMRSLIVMRELGYPIIMDATHSVQMPGQGDKTGGEPKFIEPLARAAAAIGIDGLFMEVHPNPENALSDSASQLKLDNVEEILSRLKKIDELAKKYARDN